MEKHIEVQRDECAPRIHAMGPSSEGGGEQRNETRDRDADVDEHQARGNRALAPLVPQVEPCPHSRGGEQQHQRDPGSRGHREVKAAYASRVTPAAASRPCAMANAAGGLTPLPKRIPAMPIPPRAPRASNAQAVRNISIASIAVLLTAKETDVVRPAP